MEKVIDEIRYDEKTDEFSLVFKGMAKFDSFLNLMDYLISLHKNKAK